MSDTDELLRGLKLAIVAVASAAFTAFAVIGVGAWVIDRNASIHTPQAVPETILIKTSG